MKRISSGCWGLAAAVMLVVLPSVVLGQATYVGSSKCMACHNPIYETWKGTLHNRSQQEVSATNDPVVVDWKGVVKLKAGNLPEATVKLSKGPNGEYLATLVDARDSVQGEDVHRAQHLRRPRVEATVPREDRK